MADYFTRFLNGVGTGLLNPKGLVSNWQHATRLYLDNNYALSPRHKFLFYVKFEIDPTAHKAPMFTQQHSQEVGMLVKSADLPKFSIDTVIKNQYNRKKLLYKGINYDPININFHDDSTGVINALWAIYYGYYFADRMNPTAAYSATQYRRSSTTMDNFRYGMDNSITVPLFKSISLYTMSRRRFNGYTLVNPRISSWNHGNVDYADGGTLESSMSINYEAVIYSTGRCQVDSPKGFASLHYDNLPSPLSVAGGGVSNLVGDGGVLDGIEQIFGSLENGTMFDSPGGFLSTAITAVNTYKNFKGLSAESLKQEAINILASPTGVTGIANTVGGLVGTVFPKNPSTSASGDTTASQQKSLVNGTGDNP